MKKIMKIWILNFLEFIQIWKGHLKKHDANFYVLIPDLKSAQKNA